MRGAHRTLTGRERHFGQTESRLVNLAFFLVFAYSKSPILDSSFLTRSSRLRTLSNRDSAYRRSEAIIKSTHQGMNMTLFLNYFQSRQGALGVVQRDSLTAVCCTFECAQAFQNRRFCNCNLLR